MSCLAFHIQISKYIIFFIAFNTDLFYINLFCSLGLKFYFKFVSLLSSSCDMRETRYISISNNRTALTVNSSNYDRRALDTTSDKPLIYTLNNLTYLVASSARLRETLLEDGGLARLVNILKECTCSNKQVHEMQSPRETIVQERNAAWKWSLAFQCLVYIAARGDEVARSCVASSGIISIICTVLDNYLELVAKISSFTKRELRIYCSFLFAQ